MRNYKLFLAYYTLIACLLLFAWSVFFGPKPQAFLLTLLLAPIGIYFCMLFTHPSVGDEAKDSRLPIAILATLFVSSLSIFVYATVSNRLTNPNPPASLLTEMQSLRQEVAKLNLTQEQENKAAAELQKIKTELANLKSTSQNTISIEDILGVASPSGGLVTIKDSKNRTVNVYQEKNTSSKVLTKMEFGQNYPFIDKSPDWYQVVVNNQTGFVSSQFVK